MSELCTIKANSHGINLLLSPDAGFEELITDICKQFASGRAFFGKTEIILEVTGRDMTLEELRVVVEAIELNSDVKVKLLADSDPDSGKRALHEIESFLAAQKKEKVRIIPDNIAEGAAMAFDETVVVMGDVKYGASLAAAGHVIIMGGLYGSVCAGGSTDQTCFVAVAGEVASTEVIIGGVSGDIELPPPQPKGFFRRKETTPKGVSCFAIYSGKLVMEPMKEGIIAEILG